MKINAINITAQAFRANEEPLGFDDSVSQANRNYIRDHYNPLPYYDVIENNGRLGEYELNKLIGGMLGTKVDIYSMKNIAGNLNSPSTRDAKSQTIKVEDDSVKKAKIQEAVIQDVLNHQEAENTRIDGRLMYSLKTFNPMQPKLSNVMEIFGMNSYRGGTSNIKEQDMDVMRKAGIKRVISLMDQPNSDESFKRHGLEHFRFDDMGYMFEVRPYNPQEEAQAEIIQLEAKGERLSNDRRKEILENKKNIQKAQEQSFIDSLVKYVTIMEKDNVYVGCSMGTERTDCAMMINYFFNPKASKTSPCLNMDNIINLAKIENFYYKLTSDAKKLMGWTEEFDRNFIPKLTKLMKQQGLR